EQQAISAFAARHFARRRQAGIADPPELASALVTIDLLRATGVSEDEIRTLLYQTYYGQAYAAGRVGDLASAVPLMARAAGYTSVGVARRAMAELSLAVARARRAGGQSFRHRAPDLLRAFQLAPGNTFKHLRRGLR